MVDTEVRPRRLEEIEHGARAYATCRRTRRKTLGMSPRAIMDKDGKLVSEGDPRFDRVRLDNLEDTMRELQRAIVDIQHRLSRLDGEDLQWPGDTYEPIHTSRAD